MERKSRRSRTELTSTVRLCTKVPTPEPADIPAKWRGLIGEYGWDHDILYVFEKEGHLNVLIEWVEFDALTETSTTMSSSFLPAAFTTEKKRSSFATRRATRPR